MYSSAFQNAPSASVWLRQHLHVHQAKTCRLWGNTGTSEGTVENCLDWKKVVQLPK